MTNIYQQIWDADQTGAGLKPVLDGAAADRATGFVRVASGVGSSDFKLLPEVVIPLAKRASYERVTALFDNYALDEQDPENETPEERAEVHDFLTSILDTAPMQVARNYVAEATQSSISTDRWYATLLELWFRRFSAGGDPDLSGFEHVVVGEQQGPKVQGYHFWYKYWLDDGFASVIDRNRLPGFRDDRIEYVRGLGEDGQENFPESVTIAYRWFAPDYDRAALRPLHKPKGGFFVGCSVEGLMAIGSVRAHMAARAPKEAIINGARYDLKMYRSPDNKNIRTLYPVFLGPASEAPIVGGSGVASEPDGPLASIVEGPVRIVAALVNPIGDDPGRETVTLVNTGATSISLAGWRLVDKLRNHFEIDEVTLGGGMSTTVTLPKNSMQMSNKGGEIRLVARSGHTIHLVTYSRAQAKREGQAILF